MSIKIAITNEKGGCGKTVTTSNLAYLMGDEGKKVLCLDTDPQGNLTFALTGGNAITSKAFANRSLYDMIDGFRYNTQTRDFIVESEYENVDLIPANDQTPRLSKRLEDLYTDAQRDYDRGDPKYLASDTDVLDYFLRQVKDENDVTIIDCQPSLGLLTVNALTAADGVIIPVAAEFFALRGVALLMQSIEKVQSRINPDLQVYGVLVTMFTRTLHCEEVLQRIYEAFQDKVFHSVISRSIKLPDATVAAAPITIYAPGHKTAKEYREVSRELIARGIVA